MFFGGSLQAIYFTVGHVPGQTSTATAHCGPCSSGWPGLLSTWSMLMISNNKEPNTVITFF